MFLHFSYSSGSQNDRTNQNNYHIPVQPSHTHKTIAYSYNLHIKAQPTHIHKTSTYPYNSDIPTQLSHTRTTVTQQDILDIYCTTFTYSHNLHIPTQLSHTCTTFTYKHNHHTTIQPTHRSTTFTYPHIKIEYLISPPGGENEKQIKSGYSGLNKTAKMAATPAPKLWPVITRPASVWRFV